MLTRDLNPTFPGRMTSRACTVAPTTSAPLSTNGLIMPPDFPVGEYEAIREKVEPRTQSVDGLYERFAGAWNALSYRFLAMTEYEEAFSASIATAGPSPEPVERYKQERDLFGFFSNGVAVFETAFYGLFSFGALLSPANFPIRTPEEQRKISPKSTANAIKKAFSVDPINQVISDIRDDPAYDEWYELRNILSHRVAPGRIFHEGGNNHGVAQWNIRAGITLDARMAPVKRAELSRLIDALLRGINLFAKSHP